MKYHLMLAINTVLILSIVCSSWLHLASGDSMHCTQCNNNNAWVNAFHKHSSGSLHCIFPSRLNRSSQPLCTVRQTCDRNNEETILWLIYHCVLFNCMCLYCNTNIIFTWVGHAGQTKQQKESQSQLPLRNVALHNTHSFRVYVWNCDVNNMKSYHD